MDQPLCSKTIVYCHPTLFATITNSETCMNLEVANTQKQYTILIYTTETLKSLKILLTLVQSSIQKDTITRKPREGWDLKEQQIRIKKDLQEQRRVIRNQN